MRSSLRIGLLAVLAAGAVPAQTPTGQSLGTDGVAGAAAVPQISIRGSPMLGNPQAPVTIVEFSDYQCPFCRGFAKNTFPRIKANYIDTGKVRFVIRDFPLSRHPLARPAAIAVSCAGEQGWFWEMHDVVLTEGDAPDEALIQREAAKLGLDPALFAACRTARRQEARIEADVAAAGALGVSGTPSFLVGESAGDRAQGRLLKGGPDYDTFAKILDGYLKPGE